MKVKDLSKETNLTKVKVRLPDDVLRKFKNYGGGVRSMWIVGWTHGDFFFSPHQPKSKERRLFPAIPFFDQTAILNWKVVKNLN